MEFDIHNPSELEVFDDALLDLYRDVLKLINHYFYNQGNGRDIVARVHKSVNAAALAFYNKEIQTPQEIANALPSHSEVLAVRFMCPHKNAYGSIAGALAAMGQAHLLQVPATGPINDVGLSYPTANTYTSIAKTIAGKTEARLRTIGRELDRQLKDRTPEIANAKTQLMILAEALKSVGLGSRDGREGKAPGLTEAELHFIIDVAIGSFREASGRQILPNQSSASQFGTLSSTQTHSSSGAFVTSVWKERQQE